MTFSGVESRLCGAQYGLRVINKPKSAFARRESAKIAQSSWNFTGYARPPSTKIDTAVSRTD